jgi:hypothetical protein
MDDYWKDIWKEEPPRNEDILFMTGSEQIRIGRIFSEEKLRKCEFHCYVENRYYDCDQQTELKERVLFWHPLPKFKEE